MPWDNDCYLEEGGHLHLSVGKDEDNVFGEVYDEYDNDCYTTDLNEAYRIEDAIQAMSQQQEQPKMLQSVHLELLGRRLDDNDDDDDQVEILSTLTRVFRICGVKDLFLRIGGYELLPYIVELIFVAQESIHFELCGYPNYFNDADVMRLLSAVEESPYLERLQVVCFQNLSHHDDDLMNKIRDSFAKTSYRLTFGISDGSDSSCGDASLFSMDEEEEEPALQWMDLPDQVHEKILRTVSNPYDLLACERTCRTYRRILRKDDVWQDCRLLSKYYGADDRLSHRENAFVAAMLRKIRERQKDTTNTVLQTFDGPEAFRRFFNGIALVTAGYCPTCAPNVFVLRGDTMGYIVELLQDYFVSRISKANTLATDMATFSNSNTYPVIEQKHFDLLERLGVDNKVPHTMHFLNWYPEVPLFFLLN